MAEKVVFPPTNEAQQPTVKKFIVSLKTRPKEALLVTPWHVIEDLVITILNSEDSIQPL